MHGRTLGCSPPLSLVPYQAVQSPSCMSRHVECVDHQGRQSSFEALPYLISPLDLEEAMNFEPPELTEEILMDVSLMNVVGFL